VLFVPLYTIVFPLLGYHLQPVQAVQLGLFTEIFGFSSSATAFWRRGLIDFRIAGFALLFAIPAAVLGSYVANLLPGSWFLFLISMTLLSFAYLLLRQASIEQQAKAHTKTDFTQVKEHRDRQGRVYQYIMHNDLPRAIAAAFGGLFQGLVGFSSGEVSTVEQVLRSVPVRLAVGNAHFIIAGASLAAVSTHLAVIIGEKGSIPWNILAASVPGVLIGGQIAGFIAGRLPQNTLQMIMARFLLFIGVISLYRALLNMGLRLPPWLLLVALALFLISVVAYLANNLPRRDRPAKVSSEVSGRSCCGTGCKCDSEKL
jgi:uncharacterized protein